MFERFLYHFIELPGRIVTSGANSYISDWVGFVLAVTTWQIIFIAVISIIFIIGYKQYRSEG